MDKTEAANLPVWTVSLDLSKAFDRIDWDMLWEALADQGISAHLRWSNAALYCDQQGQLITQSGHRRDFNIHASVRQGCVLSPKLFCSAVQHVMRKWRADDILRLQNQRTKP